MTARELTETAREMNELVRGYPLAFDVTPAIGITIAEDRSKEISRLLDEASLACEQCKGNYLRQYEFYDREMEERVVREQNIVNNMETALADGNFVLYLQPKYDLTTSRVDGAEVLVRWLDKERGVVKPGDFIPLFERNGFITRLDYYVWEHTCMMLRRWLDSGRKVCPVSVNISRVNLYNPKLAEVICGLVSKYSIPVELLQLELTESAYANIPELMKNTMKQLRAKGFKLLMDDFGSGYSSLNVLKDIVVDVLKIDMKFLSDCDTPGRGENILDSILRMAKWLDTQVLVEGVETLDQVTFLRNIGCEYVQGYYFAEPMPVEEFEKKIIDSGEVSLESQRRDEAQVEVSSDMIWSAASQMEKLFSNVMQAVALYEFDGFEIEVLRVNDAYTNAFGSEDLTGAPDSFMKNVLPEDRLAVSKTFASLADARGAEECEFRRVLSDGRVACVHAMLKYVKNIATKTIVLASLYDVTQQKQIERELQNYRAAITASRRSDTCLLVIDDTEVDRAILSSIFKDEYTVLEAGSAEEGLRLLREKKDTVDLVLLDMMMPGMGGLAFLKELRKDAEIADIPVVVATVDASANMQNKMLEIGARDYILKPFVPAVVFRRVCNVLESERKLGESLRGAGMKKQVSGN
jgi:PAS domain S-box-containing protein